MLVFICLFAANCNNIHKTDEKIIGYISVDIGDFDRTESVVSILLDDITYAPDSVLALYELDGNERVLTDVQILTDHDKRYMHWILHGDSQQGEKRLYELVLEESTPAVGQSSVSIIDQDGGRVFLFNGKKVLKYNTQTVYPPPGVDTSYKRSGFIHPLYAPNQAILTRTPDSTSDHLHHYGIWNAWKKTQFRGEEIDFFAPQFGQGTVRHANVISQIEGSVFSNLRVLLEHIAWQDTEKEALAMREQRDIKVYNLAQDNFIMDISFLYNPVEPLLIEEFRYAGFSFRATDYWTKDNTNIFTSGGFDRDSGDGERSEWCVVTGETPEGPVSIIIMGNPVNYNHPEPMRIWPSDAEGGSGKVFVNFSPTRNTNWSLQTGNNYLLKYRLLIADRIIDPEEAESVWKEYSTPPQLTLDKLNRHD